MTVYFATGDRIGSAEAKPEGAVILSPQEYEEALQAKLSGRETVVLDGELVIRNPAPSPEHTWKNGEWVAPEPAPPSDEELWANLRAERDGRLYTTDWLLRRHADEVALELTPTLSAQQYADLIVYRQALRDLPESTEDPAEPVWPVNPLA